MILVVGCKLLFPHIAMPRRPTSRLAPNAYIFLDKGKLSMLFQTSSIALVV